MKNKKQLSAYSLIEILVVVSIIALLSVMISTLAVSIKTKMDIAKTEALVSSFNMYLFSKPRPPPDRLTPPANKDEERVGYLMFDITEKKPGIVNKLVWSGFSFDYSNMVDSQNRVTDAWGNPIHYVLGDAKNRIGSSSYDPSKPQDLNKPKDANIPAHNSDWNRGDELGFAYIYSTGVPDPLKHEWIYFSR